jgi:Domain of unknown function (DUF4386)
MNIQQFPRLVTRGSLVAAPLLHLGSALAAASLATGAAAEVASISHHPDRYYTYTLLQLIGTALFVPLLVLLMQLARERAPLTAIVGAGLMQIGALVGVADSGTQLVYWQTAGGDPAQMTALVHRYENAAAANAIFLVGGISLMAGSLLLATALWRARVAPVWAAYCLPLGLIGSIAAQAAGDRPLLIGGSLILLAGLGRIATTREPGRSARTAAASAH